MPKTQPSLCPDWKARLRRAFRDILAFTEKRNKGDTTTKATSRDGRVLLELSERGGDFQVGRLQLAMRKADDLEMITLGCWTLLFLKALFPTWKDVEVWAQGAADFVSGADLSMHHRLEQYYVSCRFDPDANVMEFQVNFSAPEQSNNRSKRREGA